MELLLQLVYTLFVGIQCSRVVKCDHAEAHGLVGVPSAGLHVVGRSPFTKIRPVWKSTSMVCPTGEEGEPRYGVHTVSPLASWIVNRCGVVEADMAWMLYSRQQLPPGGGLRLSLRPL